jgi:hypothetical protein
VTDLADGGARLRGEGAGQAVQAARASAVLSGRAGAARSGACARIETASDTKISRGKRRFAQQHHERKHARAMAGDAQRSMRDKRTGGSRLRKAKTVARLSVQASRTMPKGSKKCARTRDVGPESRQAVVALRLARRQHALADLAGVAAALADRVLVLALLARCALHTGQAEHERIECEPAMRKQRANTLADTKAARHAERVIGASKPTQRGDGVKQLPGSCSCRRRTCPAGRGRR